MKRRPLLRRSRKAGLPPGSLEYFGEKIAGKPTVSVMDFSEHEFREFKAKSVEDTFALRETATVSWIDISSMIDGETIEKIGEHFRIHPLILEDILTQGQRPKMEDMEDYIFVVLKMLSYDEKAGEIKAEQISIVWGRNFLISFQEFEGDVFNAIRDRIRNAKGRIRKMGTDYLAYSLIDAVIDHYFIIMEKLGERIEILEERLIENPGREALHDIHTMKQEMLFLRKSVWPLREMISGLEKSESALIHEATVMYIRDLYDHTIQIIDTVETFRDLLSGMLDIYLSSTSYRLNEVMKVLTIISTIFIPLTFIAGVYGMNFELMPELKTRWGYPAVLTLMAGAALGMVYYFWKKKWF
ncbi:MAG: magnesium/cobalt transporter CorA [Candidatus Latescibacter sp.]|nr:magnesium/cobalt transporter CorA [Candidatus Latescibacter sp.]